MSYSRETKSLLGAHADQAGAVLRDAVRADPDSALAHALVWEAAAEGRAVLTPMQLAAALKIARDRVMAIISEMPDDEGEA